MGGVWLGEYNGWNYIVTRRDWYVHKKILWWANFSAICLFNIGSVTSCQTQIVGWSASDSRNNCSKIIHIIWFYWLYNLCCNYSLLNSYLPALDVSHLDLFTVLKMYSRFDSDIQFDRGFVQRWREEQTLEQEVLWWLNLMSFGRNACHERKVILKVTFSIEPRSLKYAPHGLKVTRKDSNALELLPNCSSQHIIKWSVIREQLSQLAEQPILATWR